MALDAPRSGLIFRGLYLLAALSLCMAEWHVWRNIKLTQRPQPGAWLAVCLLAGLLFGALAPASAASSWALTGRLITAFIGLAYVVQALLHRLTRGGLAYLLLLALGVLVLCGLGFWWLEPSAPSFADGLWLAFTTAATVGYGDLVPTTPASKIFAVFVVMLGYGVLSLATAAIATTWVQTEERQIEREILRDVHAQMAELRTEMASLRESFPSQATPHDRGA